VFGGLNNMVDGLANTHSMYKPKMIAVSTTCMAEVIGDDLNAFIKTAKEKGSVPAEYDVPFAHTPAFVGSHITGYDNALKGIIEHFWDGKAGTAPKLERQPNDKINFIGGFDGYTVGNTREIKRLFNLMGVEYTVIADNSEVFDTPTDGEFRMYDGGTKIGDVKAAVNAKATISLQRWNTRKTLEYAGSVGQETASFHYPMGVRATDELLMKISAVSGKAIPESIRLERGRLIDAMADSQAYLHGKKYAIYGDPDFVTAMARFVMETGGEPVHCLATNGTKHWEEELAPVLAASPFGKDTKIWAGRDLWHLRSLIFTEPVDMIIGNSYGKYLWGYQGGLRVLTAILDKVFDKYDAETIVPGKTDYSYDLTR
jgi:nitrogenase molybdenum-iron protein beta chain